MHPAFLLGMVASFLPAQLRPRSMQGCVSDLRRPAILSGLAQMTVCMGTVVLGYRPFVMSQFAATDPRAVSAGVQSSGETAVMGLGLMIAVAYLLRPLTLALFYFSFEGAIRAITAFVSGEIVGTLPLYLLLLTSRKAREEVSEFRMGPRICDTVIAAKEGETEYDLMIASCRPKDWNQSLTISYEDQFYELVGSFDSDPPRRFVYLLKKAPISKLVRGLHVYDPEERIIKEPEVLARP